MANNTQKRTSLEELEVLANKAHSIFQYASDAGTDGDAKRFFLASKLRQMRTHMSLVIKNFEDEKAGE